MLSAVIWVDSVKITTKLRGIWASLLKRFKDRVKVFLLRLTNA